MIDLVIYNSAEGYLDPFGDCIYHELDRLES